MDCSLSINNKHQSVFGFEQKQKWSGIAERIKNAIPQPFELPIPGILREIQFTRIGLDHEQILDLENETDRGVSTFIFGDGSKAIFHHQAGKLDGPGTYVAMDGTIEEFSFKKGKCKNAARYSSDYFLDVECLVGDEPYGKANLRFPDGSYEICNYHFGLKSGPAKRIFLDGRIENFTYAGGLESGKATNTFPDGSHEFFEYKQGKKEGTCIITLPDGSVCMSTFACDLPLRSVKAKIVTDPSPNPIKMAISKPPMEFLIPRERLSKLSEKFDVGLHWLKAEEYQVNTDALALETAVAFVNYLRLGRVLFTEDNFWPLFLLANEHDIKPLFKKCFSFAKKNLTTDLIYEFGSSIASEELTNFCLYEESLPDLIHFLNTGEKSPHELGIFRNMADFFGEQCSEITMLDLRKKPKNCWIKGEDIEKFPDIFPNLKCLLFGTKTLLTDQNSHHLAKLSALETLDIGGTPITDLSFLKNLKRLKVLNLSGCKKIKDFTVLQHLDSLKKVYHWERREKFFDPNSF